MGMFKVEGGTPSSTKDSKCESCYGLVRIQGENELIFQGCSRIGGRDGAPMPITEKVTECSLFVEKRMDDGILETAWVMRPTKDGPRFVKPRKYDEPDFEFDGPEELKERKPAGFYPGKGDVPPSPAEIPEEEKVAALTPGK